MAIKNQLKKLKENWLLAILVLVVIVFLTQGSNIVSYSYNSMGMENYGVMDSLTESSSRYSSVNDYGSADFAPESTDRKITVISSLSTEVKRGTYMENEKSMKDIIKLSDSFLLSENSNDYGLGRKSQYSGNYQIKVEVKNYESVISQLKEIGEVKSFNSNMQDITGNYEKTEIELASEKTRLSRYEGMYSEATTIQDKLDLNDRIFDQERKIKYLEDSLNNLDKRVEYSTIYFSMTEERSSYANIVLVKFGQLVQDLVDSFNFLISLLFKILPWVVAYFIVRFIINLIKKKK